MKNEEKQQEFGHELHPHSVQEMDAKALLFKKKSNKSQKEKTARGRFANTKENMNFASIAHARSFFIV